MSDVGNLGPRANNRAVYEKLKDVISENKELEKMVSAGRVEQLGMDIGLLKRENEGLRETIDGAPDLRKLLILRVQESVV